MKRAIKLIIIFYILGALVLLSTILYSNNHYSEAALGDRVNQTIYGKKLIFHHDTIDSYKYISTLSERFLGLYNVEASLTGEVTDKVSHRTSSLLFCNENLFSMRVTQHDHHLPDDKDHDLSGAHIANHSHAEFYQIIYNKKGILCNASLTTDSVQCFQFMN